MVSKLTVDDVIAASVKRRGLQCFDSMLYWIEQRPQAKGRSVLVEFNPRTNTLRDVTPEPLSLRSTVHEYGGGDFLVTEDGIFYVNAVDQQIYCQTADSIYPLTRSETNETRYADFAYDPRQKRLFSVRERHLNSVINDVVSIDQSGRVLVVAEGADFYAAPRLSPDGQHLCWLQWHLPNMPWDGCTLWELTIPSGERHCVAGGDQCSVLAPSYDEQGTLWFVDDRDGFWRVRNRCDPNTAWSPSQMDCGIAAWSLGQQPYCVAPGQQVFSLVFNNAQFHLAHNREVSNQTFAECGAQLIVSENELYFFASTATTPEQLVRFEKEKLARNNLSCDLAAGRERVETIQHNSVHAYFYQPENVANYPLVVFCHSGPTGMASCAYNPLYQLYLQQGFAVLDINYRGSYGYGREYRQALCGRWGELDVDDCQSVITHLLQTRAIDSQRVYLRGNSAGGLTVLFLLARYPALFRAAGVRYPVVDLASLQAISHKFELGYLATLIGAQSPSDARWSVHSPINQVNNLKTPMLICQGENDPVVPMSQAEALKNALDHRSIPCELLRLEGEGHGFRQAANLKQCLQAELDWFQRWQ